MKWILLSISTFFCQSINITFSTLQQARPLLDERNLDKLVDLQLHSKYNGCQMQAMIAAAALCVQESSQLRPQISQVCSFAKQVHLQQENLDLCIKFLSTPWPCISKSSSCKNLIQEIFCTRQSAPFVSPLISEWWQFCSTPLALLLHVFLMHVCALCGKHAGVEDAMQRQWWGGGFKYRRGLQACVYSGCYIHQALCS